MRKFLLFILAVCAAFDGIAGAVVLDRLRILNSNWSQHEGVAETGAVPDLASGERDWIRYHLQQVEQTLRRHPGAGLTAGQRLSRDRSLDDLNRYWKAAQFPVNLRYAARTPIFIDDRDNFCAVGYLLKASGHEALARSVSATANLSYLREMHVPGLDRWAKAHGFTRDELAWIQPTYGPHYTSMHVGKGTNGEVRTMHVDSLAGKMYVGGDFTAVDSTTPARYIAAVTEARGGFAWEAIGTGGPSGPVYAITQFDGKLFTAGAAGADYWDGSVWRGAGTLSGTMRALQVLNSELYVAGDFSDAGGNTGSFAKWNGGDWELISGLEGRVNTMTAGGSGLILGGKLTLSGLAANAVSWTATGSFRSFDAPPENEVIDLSLFEDTVYAACRRNVQDSTKMLMKLRGNEWVSAVSGWGMQPFSGPQLTFNSLCPDGMSLIVGGSFAYRPMIGSVGANVLSFQSYAGTLLNTDGEWITVDGPVNKIIRFNSHLIYGGSMPKYLNITAAQIVPASVAGTEIPGFSILPNPLRTGGTIRVQGALFSGNLSVRDMQGHMVVRRPVQLQQTADIRLPELRPGNYLMTLEDKRGAATRVFTVQ